MTTHANDSGRSEDASNVSQEHIDSVVAVICDADGPPYELTTHYLFYGPTHPNDYVQAAARAGSRDLAREYARLDFRLIE